MRSGDVRVNGISAGVVKDVETGFQFQYHKSYVDNSDLQAVSLTLPKRYEAYESSILFPFFAGLLTEGAIMRLQCQMLKLDEHDLFGRLLKTSKDDVIGAVSIHEIEEVGS